MFTTSLAFYARISIYNIRAESEEMYVALIVVKDV